MFDLNLKMFCHALLKVIDHGGRVPIVKALVVDDPVSGQDRQSGRDLRCMKVMDGADVREFENMGADGFKIESSRSATVLASLVLNSLFGWSWTDPIAALIIGGFAIREGIEAWKGDIVPSYSA